VRPQSIIKHIQAYQKWLKIGKNMGNLNKQNRSTMKQEDQEWKKVDQRPTEINCSTHNQKLP